MAETKNYNVMGSIEFWFNIEVCGKNKEDAKKEAIKSIIGNLNKHEKLFPDGLSIGFKDGKIVIPKNDIEIMDE